MDVARDKITAPSLFDLIAPRASNEAAGGPSFRDCLQPPTPSLSSRSEPQRASENHPRPGEERRAQPSTVAQESSQPAEAAHASELDTSDDSAAAGVKSEAIDDELQRDEEVVAQDLATVVATQVVATPPDADQNDLTEVVAASEVTPEQHQGGEVVPGNDLPGASVKASSLELPADAVPQEAEVLTSVPTIAVDELVVEADVLDVPDDDADKNGDQPEVLETTFESSKSPKSHAETLGEAVANDKANQSSAEFDAENGAGKGGSDHSQSLELSEGERSSDDPEPSQADLTHFQTSGPKATGSDQPLPVVPDGASSAANDLGSASQSTDAAGNVSQSRDQAPVAPANGHTSGAMGTVPKPPASLLKVNGSHPESSGKAGELDPARFLNRVVKAFESAHQRDSEVRLRLHPAELGSLSIEVKIQEGVLSARLLAETSEARSTLMENLPQLRERLAEQGIRIEKFDVDLMDHSDRQQQFLHDEAQNRGGQRSETARASSARAAAEREASPIIAQRPSGASGLNVVI